MNIAGDAGEVPATVSNQAIADDVLRGPALVPALGVEELTCRVNVSAANLSRFVRAMGFGLSAHLAATLALHLQPFCKRCTTVVAITDSQASPLASLAHHVLLAPAAHSVLSSSMGEAMAVIEALVTALMVSNRNNVKQAA